jgi:hypothetical protein
MDIKAAKAGLDCRLEVEKILGEPRSRNGRTWCFDCIFHDEATPGAFQVYEDGYHCFSCGVSGDLFDFMAKYCNRPLAEVLRGYRVNPEEELRQKALAAEKAEERLKNEIERAQEALLALQEAKAWVRYHNQMTDHSRALWRGRGVPDWYQDDMSFGYDPNHSIFAGGKEYLSPTLTISIWNRDTVVGIKHRVLNQEEGCPKYYPEMSGLGQPLFIANKDKDVEGKTVLVEGEIKAAVTFVTLDDPNVQVLGLPGKEPKDALLKRLDKCDPIYMILDPDAYQKPSPERPSAAAMIAKTLGAERILSVRLPEKIDDIIVKYGLEKEWMQSILKQAVKL